MRWRSLGPSIKSGGALYSSCLMPLHVSVAQEEECGGKGSFQECRQCAAVTQQPHYAAPVNQHRRRGLLSFQSAPANRLPASCHRIPLLLSLHSSVHSTLRVWTPTPPPTLRPSHTHCSVYLKPSSRSPGLW